MPRGFDTTHWSVVLAAQRGDGSRAHAALEELCTAYWEPLYAFVRRLGHSPDEAADLTQAYFLRFLEKGYLTEVAPERGRFRAFLLASMRHFVANEWDRRRAQRRAGDLDALSLDFLVAEERFAAADPAGRTPEEEYERRWALAVLERSLAALAASEQRAGRAEEFEALKSCLTDGVDASYAELGLRLGRSEGAIRVAVHRLRRRFGETLRRTIGETVADSAEIDAELKHLLRALA